MKQKLIKIGIKNESFDLVTVDDLIKAKIIDKPLDGNHGEIHPISEDFVESGVPFIMASDINAGSIDYTNCKFITAKQADSLRKGFAKNGDVLVTHKASIGRTAIVNYSLHPYIMLTPQVTYYRIKNREKLNNRYLKYYFDSELFQKTIHMWAGSGSTRAYIGITAQHKLPVICPPLNIQKKIAAILAAYDDLIENNRRRIAILENMAEEIYREWFVRFRFPGYQSVEFEKGVPKGWKKITFGSICKFDKGKNPEEVTELPDEDMALYVNVESLTGEGKNYAKKQKNSVECQIGDILMLMDGSRSGLVFRANNRGIVGSTLSVIRMEKSLKNYIYEYLQAMREAIIFNNTGSAIPHANKEYINRMIVFISEDESIILKFNNVYDGIYAQIDNLRQQNIQLENTKKALLPRLISGKLSVENLDIQFPPSMIEDGAA